MRENKFKVWDKTNKTMWLPHEMRGQRNLMLTPWGEVRICDWKDDGQLSMYDPLFFHFEMILLRFTGLLDKNDVEIWSGDIVEQVAVRVYPGEYGGEIDLLYIGEVVILPSKGVCLKRPMVTDRLDGDRKYRCDYYKNISSYRSKVIGNIHENPDLLP